MSITGSKRPLSAPLVEQSFHVDKKPRLSGNFDVSDPSEIAFDKISIHKLNSQKLVDQKSVEEFIEKIIRIYNGNKPDPSDIQGTFQPVLLKQWDPPRSSQVLRSILLCQASDKVGPSSMANPHVRR